MGLAHWRRPHWGYRLHLRRQISRAYAERSFGGVRRIMATASGTLIWLDSPFMLITAISHCARFRAPPASGLNCRVRRPSPRRLKTTPSLVLQERQFQIRLLGREFCS